MSDVEIRGYRGDVGDVRALVERVRKDAPGVQLLRADRVYGRDHLRLAATLAARAVAQGRARAQDVQTESALYAAGERQIGKALSKMGLEPGTREIAALAWGREAGEALDALARELGWARDDAVLEGDDAVLAHFEVTEEERALFPRERWGDLVLERVALVDVLKA